jgi:hypothetical protein
MSSSEGGRWCSIYERHNFLKSDLRPCLLGGVMSSVAAGMSAEDEVGAGVSAEDETL